MRRFSCISRPLKLRVSCLQVSPVAVARTQSVTFASPLEPTQPHLSLAPATTATRPGTAAWNLMWVSGKPDPLQFTAPLVSPWACHFPSLRTHSHAVHQIPVVQYGTVKGNYSQLSIATTQTYGLEELCGAPANTSGWVDPGLQVTAECQPKLDPTRRRR